MAQEVHLLRHCFLQLKHGFGKMPGMMRPNLLEGPVPDERCSLYVSNGLALTMTAGNMRAEQRQPLVALMLDLLSAAARALVAAACRRAAGRR